MPQTVLITGATGLIGKQLIRLLLDNGYLIHTLSRREQVSQAGIKSFVWDLEKNLIDKRCMENVSAVIHLAGESIAAKPWTNARKKQIIESRTKSISLIYQCIKEHGIKSVETVVSASATGFYGSRNDELLTEKSLPGNDFMARVCIEWEKAVDEGKKLGMRVVKLRTGIVLSSEGGALPLLARTARVGFSAALGTGKQWFPWIHKDDVLRMYLFVLQNTAAEGAFNQTAPNPVTNRQLAGKIAKVFKKPFWLPPVPAFILRIAMGEMSAVILNSTKTSASKIINLGFTFRFREVDEALKDIYEG